MQELKQWILWKYEDTGGKKLSKVPYQINGDRAKPNDKTTWSDYNTVKAVLYNFDNEYDGIGFVFTTDDDYVGIDLDFGIAENVKDDIINTLDSYTELSPSGKGYHIIVKGKKTVGANRRNNIEIYDNLRYFTITENIINNKNTVQERQKELDYICKKYLCDAPKQSNNNTGTTITSTLSDDEIIKLAGNAKNGDTFKALYGGDITGYGSQSEADIKLCSILAFWCGRDKVHIDRIFRTSGLYRPKWDEKHKADGRTYGQITIDTACSNCVDVYKPKQENRENKQEQKDLDIIYLDTVKPVTVEWLLYPYLPLGKVIVLAGEQGIGKSFFTLYLVSKFSKGISSYNTNDLFFGIDLPPQKILYQNAEDGIADTIVPRLIKLNANMSNIAYLREKISFSDSRLEQLFQKVKPTIAIFDPVQSFIDAKVDTHKVNEVRQSLDILINLGSKYNCTIILIMHNNKLGNQKMLYRVTGSVDFTALPRSVLSAVQDPQDPNNLLIIHSKSNLARKGQTLKFTKLDDTIEFTGYSDITDYKMDNPYSAGEKASPKLEQAIEFLQDYLQDGAKTRKEINQELYKRGLDIGKDTLIKAGDILNISMEKLKGFGTGTIWYIP